MLSYFFFQRKFREEYEEESYFESDDDEEAVNDKNTSESDLRRTPRMFSLAEQASSSFELEDRREETKTDDGADLSVLETAQMSPLSDQAPTFDSPPRGDERWRVESSGSSSRDAKGKNSDLETKATADSDDAPRSSAENEDVKQCPRVFSLSEQSSLQNPIKAEEKSGEASRTESAPS